MKQKPIIVSVLRIVLPYLVLGAAWILFSDRLILAITGDARAMIVLSIAKGWLYVLVTGGLLFALIYGELRGRAVLELRLRDGLAEKSALLAELNHRVKNNLQVIASILNLETEKIEGAEARALNDRTMARIRAMEIAHERLFETGEIAHMELDGYVRALWDVLADILATKKSHPLFELENVSARADKAVPFGLFVTEAITNAILYGSGPDETSEVIIGLRALGLGEIELKVQDRGPGLPFGAEGLGLRLMDALGAQLKGSVMHENEGGAIVRLRFAAEDSSRG